jgi:hypothetical protein
LYEPHQLVHVLCNAIKVGSKFQRDVLTLRKDEYIWQTAAIDIIAAACS